MAFLEKADQRTGILILTDRLSDAARLQQRLETIGPCLMAALHQVPAQPGPRSIIVCDVAFDNLTSIQLLQAALLRLRQGSDIPILCLLRDPSQLTQTYALSMGAASVLPSQASPSELIAAVKKLIGADRDDGDAGAATDLQADVRTAGLCLATMFDAARQRKSIPHAALDQGASTVLAVIRHADLRGWLDIVWRYDDHTYQHCLLVAGFAAAFAARLGLSIKHQRLLSKAALVHDIGKAHIPLAVLNKVGRLTAAEMSITRTHAALGHGMLASQAGFDQQILDIVLHHHEYLDGSGYPDGLRGQQISQFVRLTTICDIYAALIERRVYKPPIPPTKALSILAEMGGKLDTTMVQAFERMILES